ncbi:hypothetical protein LTS10_012336 [Elasticomyces elasticus]|nr:hypothetical protein LTS10_012336 [Elasticomyces elasticus]
MHTPTLLTTFLLTTLSLAAPTPITPKRQDLGELEGIVGTALPTILENLPNALNAIITGVDTPTTTEEQKRHADDELEGVLETALPVIVANLPNALDSIINGVDTLTPAEKRQDPGELEGVHKTALPVIVADLPNDGIVNGY